MTLEITADDVAKGERCDSYACPVAHAVARLFPQAKVAAGQRRVWFGERMAFYSKELEREIARFDNYGEFEPGVYEMREAFHNTSREKLSPLGDGCGVAAPADHNAARNIRARGLRARSFVIAFQGSTTSMKIEQIVRPRESCLL